MLNRSASLAMSTSVLKALPGKLDIKRHSPSILYLLGLLDPVVYNVSNIPPRLRSESQCHNQLSVKYSGN